MWDKEKKLHFLEETLDDYYEVENLLNLVFTPQRTRLSSYYFRQKVSKVGKLCKVIKNEYGNIIGSIRYWPIYLGNERLKCLLLGPLAVHPTCQGEGIGAILVFNTLSLAEKAGWERVILVGDEEYYSRFGFEKELTKGVMFPNPVNKERVLGRELRIGAFKDIEGPVIRFE